MLRGNNNKEILKIQLYKYYVLLSFNNAYNTLMRLKTIIEYIYKHESVNQ